MTRAGPDPRHCEGRRQPGRRNRLPAVTIDLLARPLGGRAPAPGQAPLPPTGPRTRAARQTPARQDPDHIRQSCDRLPRRSRLRMGTSARAALSALAVRTTYPQAAGRAPRVRPPRPRKAKPCRTSPRSWTATGPSPAIPARSRACPGSRSSRTYFEVAIIHHTDCGSTLLADDDLRHGFAQCIGSDERALADTPVLDRSRAVQTDVNRVLWAEEIPQNIHVSGHVYDVDTGLVTTIVDARARK